MTRQLYLIFYDVRDRKRLTRVHDALIGFSISTQKSFFECWMLKHECYDLLNTLDQLIDITEDRIHVFQLDPRQTPTYLGRAMRQTIAPFLVI